MIAKLLYMITFINIERQYSCQQLKIKRNGEKNEIIMETMSRKRKRYTKKKALA